MGVVFSPLLFILVLEALLRVQWEHLYADDLVLIAGTKKEYISKLKERKAGMESKRLGVDTKKTKFLVSGDDNDVLQKFSKYSCAVCSSGVGRNFILCSQCKLWAHKTCNGITKRLVEDPGYICPKCKRPGCKGEFRPIDGGSVTEVDVDGTMLDVEPAFCCLGNMLCSGGDCDSAIAARCCVAWGEFRKLLPILIIRHLSPRIGGKVYGACIC